MDVSTFPHLISRLTDGIPGIEPGAAPESRLKARHGPCAHRKAAARWCAGALMLPQAAIKLSPVDRKAATA